MISKAVQYFYSARYSVSINIIKNLEGLVDNEFYSSYYEDIKTSKMPPVVHYYRYGYTEGRWPNPFFDTEYYKSCLAAGNEDKWWESIKNGKKVNGKYCCINSDISFYINSQSPLKGIVSLYNCKSSSDIINSYKIKYDSDKSGGIIGLSDVVSKNENEYESIGEDPQLLKKIKWRGFGVYKFNMRIKTSSEKNIGKLYWCGREGFKEGNSIAFKYGSNEVIKKYLIVESYADQIRFDPMEEKGFFKIDTFEVKKANKIFVIIEIIYRYIKSSLSSMNNANKSKQHSGIVRKVIREFKRNGITKTLIKYDNKLEEKYEYSEWIRRVEKNKKNIIPKSFNNNPLVSIVLPVYKTNVSYLKECIESVLNQTYRNIELCICDDNSQVKEITELLNKYEREESRVKVIVRKENGHISLATNDAIKISCGEYIAFLDHDDVYALNAIEEVVNQINIIPNAILIYSDEDKIDRLGQRFMPHFKSDWNADLLLSQNYICHLTVLKKDLITSVSGLRVGMEGSQDHDLLLRLMSKFNDSNVVHIPKILYHWRSIEGSTAADPNAKSYTTEAGIKAIQSLLGPKVTVEMGYAQNNYRIKWQISDPKPQVDIIIPTKDKLSYLKKSINSLIEKTDYRNYTIIVINNNSREEETLKYLDEISGVSNIQVYDYSHEFNYSAINNFAVKKSNGEILLLLNNDVEIINESWLSEMVSQVLREGVGCVGAKLLYENNTVQHAGVLLGIGGVANHSHLGFNKDDYGYFGRLMNVQTVSAVTGACLAIRRSVFEEVGGLDEVNLKVAFNDVDLCLKVIKKGYRNIWTPFALLYHYESISRGKDLEGDKRQRFIDEVTHMQKMYSAELESDPYYNINLNQSYPDYDLNKSMYLTS